MDLTAVLAKVIQEQQLEIQEQHRKMDSMEKEMEILKSTVKQLLEQ